MASHWIKLQVISVASKEQTNFIFADTDYMTPALHLPGLSLSASWKRISKTCYNFKFEFKHI